MHPERRDSAFTVTNTAFAHAGSSAQDDTTSGALPLAERTYDIVDIDTATAMRAEEDSSRLSASEQTCDSADTGEDVLARMGGYVEDQGSSGAA